MLQPMSALLVCYGGDVLLPVSHVTVMVTLPVYCIRREPNAAVSPLTQALARFGPPNHYPAVAAWRPAWKHFQLCTALSVIFVFISTQYRLPTRSSAGVPQNHLPSKHADRHMVAIAQCRAEGAPHTNFLSPDAHRQCRRAAPDDKLNTIMAGHSCLGPPRGDIRLRHLPNVPLQHHLTEPISLASFTWPLMSISPTLKHITLVLVSSPVMLGRLLSERPKLYLLKVVRYRPYGLSSIAGHAHIRIKASSRPS